MEEIEQVPNTYYYDKLYDDKHLGSFTENTACETIAEVEAITWQETSK